MKLAILSIALLGTAMALPTVQRMSSEGGVLADAMLPTFVGWAKEHGKAYDTEEALFKAFATFKANDAIIRDLNANDEGTAEYGHNVYSDVSAEDFKRARMAFTMDAALGKEGASQATLSAAQAPASFDWRDHNALTPIKDQASCGSCWAFSAVETLESYHFIANNSTMNAPVPLSIEQVIECDAYDEACYGGFPSGAFHYIKDVGGLSPETEYPYVVDGKVICLANQTFNATCGDGMCDDPPLVAYCDLTCSGPAKKSSFVGKISGFEALPEDEDQIAAYLAAHGPVSVALDASGTFGLLAPWLQFYKKGIANPKTCHTTPLDHAVVIVGFGEESGTKYWTVRNSWGAKWGEEGFFRLVRGQGKCGINTLAVAPTGVH